MSGDTISLQAGITYTGNFTLPDKNNAAVIIIRTTPSGSLPGVGVRATPAHAAFMAKIRSGNSTAAIQVLAGAERYTFENIEFQSNLNGFNRIIEVGYGDSTQYLASQQPTFIVFDRIYIHGDPVAGQKAGIGMNGANISLTNSTCLDIHGIGQDTTCWSAWNGAGPFTITNNFLQSAGYAGGVIGGTDPWIRTFLTVTGSATTTGAAVQIVEANHNCNELVSGMQIAIEVGTAVQFANLTATPSAGTTCTLAWSPAVSAAPAVGARIRRSLVASGLTFTGNHVSANTFWRDHGVLLTPTTPTAIASTASGTLPAGTYFYRVQAFATGYTGLTVNSNLSGEVSAVLSAAGNIALDWPDITGETSWRVWRCLTSGATSCQWTAAATDSFTDSGTATWTTANTFSGTRPVTKNLFELKAAQNVTISGNIFENHWKGSQSGWALWLKSSNDDGSCWTCQTHTVMVEHNIFRHIDGWLLVSGTENYNANPLPPAMRDVTLRHNLVFDSNSSYSQGLNIVAFTIVNGAVNLVIDHNTVVHTMHGLLNFGGSVHPGFIMRNNMLRREFWGLRGDGVAEGGGAANRALETYAPGYIFTNNAIADAPSTQYPAGNFFPTVADWEAAFVSYSATGVGANYRIKDTSAYNNAGTDGLDLGANIGAIETATAGVIVGSSTSAPVITTLTLPNSLEDIAYPSQTLQTSGGTAPYTYAVVSGSLPAGLSLIAGVISGTATTPSTNTFTIRVTDNTAQTDDQAYTVTVTAAVTITTTTLPGTEVGVAYPATTLAATGDQAPYQWALSAGTLPAGVTLATSTGVLSGTPTAVGTSNFTVQATGGLGSVDTQALSIVVSAEVLPCGPGGRPSGINGVEAKLYRRRVAPTNPTDCVARGDRWTDISFDPPLEKIATVTTPTSVTWSLMTMAVGGDGSSIIRLNATAVDHGTLPTSVLPTAAEFTSSVTVPRVALEYADFALSPCAVLSTTGRARVCVDVDGVQKLSVNGGPYIAAAGSGSSGTTSCAAGTVSPATRLTWTALVHDTAPGASWGGTLSDNEELLQTNGRYRQFMDFTGMCEVRISFRVSASGAGNAGAKLCAQYSTDVGATWNQLNGASTGITGVCGAFDVADTNSLSPWHALTSGARGDIMLRIVSFGGNDTATPVLGSIMLQVR